MSKTCSIYIDETCHLENDKQSVMCIGYTKIDYDNYQEVKVSIKAIKLKHKSPTEIKWNKLSYSRIELYKELIDYFFATPIEFRCVLIKNKSNLDHEKFNRGDHDAFYYKVVYLLLSNPYVNHNNTNYRVILDIKDTRGKERLNELKQHLDNKYKGKSPFKHLQHIRSHESELLQLTDLFIGAVSYKSRGEHERDNASKVKQEIIKYLKECTMITIKKIGKKKPHFVSGERILRQYGEVYLSLATSFTLWVLTGQIYEQFCEFKCFSQVFNISQSTMYNVNRG